MMQMFSRFFVLCVLLAGPVHAHQNKTTSGSAHYLGNEGLMIQSGPTKVLFDPFFHDDFGIYQKVPESILDALMQGNPPYDGISAVFISHAHADHFDAATMLDFLQRHPDVQLVAPQQAVTELTAKDGADAVMDRVTAIALVFGDSPWQGEVKGMQVDAVRIPHAGWPGRAEVENLVFRLRLGQGASVMHMGDADPDVEHYLPYRAHWQAHRTGHAFPPYWFYYSMEGRDILDSYLNVESHTGVHMPVKVPDYFKKGLYDFFHQPGDQRTLTDLP